MALEVTEVMLALSSLDPGPDLVVEAETLAAGSNSHPAGAVKIIVLFACTGISPLAVSVITILPSVVYAGVVAFAALSAAMLVPPEATVTPTAPENVGCARLEPAAPLAVT